VKRRMSGRVSNRRLSAKGKMAKKSAKKIKILFICTGNTCRSPMAELLFKDQLSKRELAHRVTASSAGLMAARGQPASEGAMVVSRESGLDLSSHRSRQLTRKELLEADLILVMQKSHLDYLQQDLQPLRKEIRLLSQFAEGPSAGTDIRDPFGGDKALYQDTFVQIKKSLEGLISYLSTGYEI